jgi:hypothetical protein
MRFRTAISSIPSASLKPVFFVFQKVVKFLNQFYELAVVLFFRNPLAQDVHALSFVRGHCSSENLKGLDRNRISKMNPTESDFVSRLSFAICFVNRITGRCKPQIFPGSGFREVETVSPRDVFLQENGSLLGRGVAPSSRG